MAGIRKEGSLPTLKTSTVTLVITDQLELPHNPRLPIWPMDGGFFCPSALGETENIATIVEIEQ